MNFLFNNKTKNGILMQKNKNKIRFRNTIILNVCLNVSLCDKSVNLFSENIKFTIRRYNFTSIIILNAQEHITEKVIIIIILKYHFFYYKFSSNFILFKKLYTSQHNNNNIC